MLFDLHPKEDRKELFGRDEEIDYAISQLLSKKAVCKILYSKEEQIDVRSKPQLQFHLECPLITEFNSEQVVDYFLNVAFCI